MFRLLFLILLLVQPFWGYGQEYMTKSGHVEFKSSVPLHSFKGVSDQLVGKINLADSTVDFYVDVHTLETGIGRRDDDMLETLEAKEHSFAEFYGKLASAFNPKSSKKQEAIVKGDFTIHNVTQPVTIKGTLQNSSEGLKVKASWTINMEDYNIEPPGILFYRVSEKIPVTIEATLSPN